MKRLGELLGDSKKLAAINMQMRSYEDVYRALRACEEAGIAAVYENNKGEIVSFAGPFGLALLRLYRWAKGSQRQGIPFAQAVVAFNAAIERDRAALKDAQERNERVRYSAAREVREAKQGRRRRRNDPADAYQPADPDEIFGYAESVMPSPKKEDPK